MTGLPSVSLTQAVLDPALLGAGFNPWPAQLEILRGVEENRLSVWCLGRRSSKTTSAALVGLHACLLRPELLERLRPGERGYAVAVATSVRQARLFVSAAPSIVEASPLLSELVESAAEDEIRFANGTALAAFPCSSRGGRGWPVFTLLMDEAAHFLTDTEGPAVADRVFNALEPSTTQFGELARVIVSSTPWGDSGFFSDLFHRVRSGELEGHVVQATTPDCNPTISAAWLESRRARDPESFAAEYLAEFTGGGGAFLDPDDVAGAVADRGELDPGHGRDWVAGLDPAFSSDPFGLAIVGRSTREPGRLLLGVARSLRPTRSTSFEEKRLVEDAVLDQVGELCRRFGARVVTDQYAAPQVTARLRRFGLSVRTVPMSASSKTQVFGELRARLQSGSLELYEHPELIAELRRLRSKFSAGSASVVNPRVRGSHGDVAQALSLSCWAHRRASARSPREWLPDAEVYPGIDPDLRLSPGMAF